MRFRILLTTMVLAIMQAASLRGQSSPCAPLPESPSKDPQARVVPTRDIIYDARDGSGPEREYLSLRYKARVIVINKNPFLYTYEIKMTEKEISESALAGFLSLLSPFIADQVPKTPSGAESAVQPGLAVQLSLESLVQQVCPTSEPQHTQCSEALSIIRSTDAELKSMEKNIKNVADKNGELEQAYSTVRTALLNDGPVLRNAGAVCENLHSAATHLGLILAGYQRPSLDPVLADIEELRTKAVAQQRRIRSFIRNFPVLGTNLGSELITADNAVSDARGFKANVTGLQDAIKKADTLQSGIEKVLADATSFYTVGNFGPYKLPTNVNPILKRTPVGGKTAEDIGGTRTINFGGGQRFVLAGGIAFAPLEKREFQRVQGLAKDQNGKQILDADGKPTTTNIVGLKEDSHWRVSPMVFLHTRLTDFDSFGADGLHFSMGITAKNDNKGTDVDYLLGLSLSFVQGRLFLTGGAYGGRVQKLEDGYFIGAAVPSTLAEIPVHKTTRWSPGFAISWKIK